jgi:hypothetical protein
MKTGKDLAERAARELEASPKTSTTTAGPSRPAIQDKARRDAINQVFALFRLNYHNQYYKAFEADDQLNQAKKLWVESLAEFPIEIILQAAKRCIEQAEFLPTLHRMRECCRAAQFAQLGLPDARSAYREACLAREPRNAQRWSHAAVYHAGLATGWHTLTSMPEKHALPLFEQHYCSVCDRLLAGEVLALPAPDSPAAAPPGAPDFDAQRAALKKLREETGL